METTQQLETTPALCRKRSKIDSEDDLNWLSEAELLARLAENARRLKIVENLLQT
jgi:hypothetical protein